MNSKFVGTLIFIIIAACFLTGILVYPALPLHALSHWSAAGQGNGSLARPWAAFLLPTIMLLLWGLWALLPRIDPIAPGYRSFRYLYDFLWFAIIAFFAYIYALSLGSNLGWQFNFLQAMTPALALLFIILGSLLPYIHRNWFLGIRTPWTLSSDEVWHKTHRLGGRLIQLAGLIIGGGSFANPRLMLWFILVPLVAAALISVVYSYILFAREKVQAP